MVKHGRILAVVSLPDYAFRKSGAQNKTSILFFKKFNYEQRVAFENAYDAEIASGADDETAVRIALSHNSYKVFMAEASCVGYSSTNAAGWLDKQKDIRVNGTERSNAQIQQYY